MSDATLSQRIYLADMYDRLKWDKTPIRNMTTTQASEAIRKAKAAIATGQADNDDEGSLI